MLKDAGQRKICNPPPPPRPTSIETVITLLRIQTAAQNHFTVGHHQYCPVVLTLITYKSEFYDLESIDYLVS